MFSTSISVPVRRSGAAAGTSAGPSIPDDNQNQPILGHGMGQPVGQTLGHSIPNQMNQNFNIQANMNPQMGLSGVLTPQSGAMGANGDFSFNTGLNTAGNITGNTTGNTTGGNRLGGASPAGQFGGSNRLGGHDSTTGGQFRGNSPLPNRSVTPNRPAASLTPSSRPNTPSRGGIHTFSSLPQEAEEPPQTVGGGVVLPNSGNWSGSTESNGAHLAGELGTPASTVQPPPPTLANMTGGNRLGGPTVQSTGGNVFGENTLGGNRLGGQVQGQSTPFGGGQRLAGPVQPQFTQGGTVITPSSGTMSANGDFSFGSSENTTDGNRLGGNPMTQNHNMTPSGGGNVLGGNRLGDNIAPQSAPSGGNVLGGNVLGGNTLGGGNRLGGSTIGATSGQTNYGGTINPNSGTMGSNGDFSFGTPSGGNTLGGGNTVGGGNTLGGGNRLGGNQPQYQTQQPVTISHTPGQATASGGSRLGGPISATANVSMNGQQQSAGGQGMSIPIDMSQLLGGLNLGGALGMSTFLFLIIFCPYFWHNSCQH